MKTLPSIRQRLSRAALAWSLVWSVALSLAVGLALRHELDEQLDDRLQGTAQVLAVLLAPVQPHETEALAAALPEVAPQLGASEMRLAWQVV